MRTDRTRHCDGTRHPVTGIRTVVNLEQALVFRFVCSWDGTAIPDLPAHPLSISMFGFPKGIRTNRRAKTEAGKIK